MKLQSGKRKRTNRKLVEIPSIIENSKPPSLQYLIEQVGEVEKLSRLFLPDEIIFNILRFLPADTLHNLRYVCSQWNSIIKNPQFIITHHLQQNNYPSSLILVGYEILKWCHVGNNGEFIIKSIKWKKVESHGDYLNSCNGLILMHDPLEKHAAMNGRGRYYISNPNIRRKFLLPERPFVSDKSSPCYLGFVPSSNVYKIVMLHCRGGIDILTVNVDLYWRRIDNFSRFDSDAICASNGGFLYSKYNKTNLLARFDFEREILSYVSLPKQFSPSELSLGCFVPCGNSVSFCLTNNHDYTMDVWMMKDEKTQEWVEYPSIKISLDKGRSGDLHKCLSKVIKSSSQLIPICWLNTNMIVFQFRTRNGLFVYNVKTGLSFPYMGRFEISNIIPHVNSLAWI